MPVDLRAVTQFSTQRGRASEFTAIEAGQGSLRLQNRDGAFDPTNAGSAYFGLLQPLQPVKITWPHPFTGVGYDVFSGYVEEWDPARVLATGSYTTVPLADGFELLAQAQANPAAALFYAAQHVDARIHAALDDIGWSSTRRRVATGNVNLQGITYDAGAVALDILQECANAEFPNVAMVFCDKSGNVTFTGRGIRFGISPNPPWVSYPQFCKLWRVGDDAAVALDPTLLPMADLSWSLGKEALYNDVVVAHRNASASAIASNHVTDPTSIAKFGRRSLALLDLVMLDGSTSGKSALDECRDIATYFKNNYATAVPRIKSMVFKGQMDDGMTTPGYAPGDLSKAPGKLWDFILNVELGHVLEVHTQNPGGGGFTPNLSTRVGYFFTEGISNDVSSLNDKVPKWTMTLELSPMARFATYP